ncbi:MAG TPA: VOC family protein [Bryobacteraceae bacterium]|jgi:PhnB protein|nr:VOC family protein [Bryobacteraceae bacterium]
MNVVRLNPYINLNGTAQKAIDLYQRALGAKVETVMRFGDMPGPDTPPDQKDKIMHAALQVNGNSLMISDVPSSEAALPEGHVKIAVHFTDPEETAKAFDALSSGGKVTQPLVDTFWGAKFGMVTDAYGVSWMFNCELKKTE